MIKFTKMHGAGNDFIITTSEEVKGYNYSKLAMKICDRHFGIGADGFMVVDQSKISDVKMIFYNSDGSEAEMCGNGIRCFSKYVYINGIVNKTNFKVETLAGIKDITLSLNNNMVEAIQVNMGKPSIHSKDVPVKTEKDTFINEELIINGNKLVVSSILVGVPHTVILVKDVDQFDILKVGPLVEKNDLYPMKTNVNFVQIVDENNMIVDTWERGAGKTLACGTGVCASVIISYLMKLVNNTVNVKVPGGQLIIHIEDDLNVVMEGKAELICSGEFYFPDDLKN